MANLTLKFYSDLATLLCGASAAATSDVCIPRNVSTDDLRSCSKILTYTFLTYTVKAA